MEGIRGLWEEINGSKAVFYVEAFSFLLTRGVGGIQARME
jgi:hypothetical protein